MLWRNRASLGLIAPYFDWDWEEARRHLGRAIELNPNSAIAQDCYADGCLTPVGKLDESLAELQVARRLDPLSLVILADIGKTLYFARRCGEAIAPLRRVLDMDPNFFPGATWLFKAYLEKGMYSQALAVIEAEKGYVKSLYLTDLAGVRAKMGEK